MKVLHVISNLDARAGGTTAALAALALAQAGGGLHVSVVSTHRRDADADVARQLQSNGIDVRLIGPTDKPLAWHRDIAPTLASLIPQVDVVHIHALWEEIQHRAAVVARGHGTPYVISPHGMLDPWSLRQGRLKKQIYLALRLKPDLNRAAAIHYADRVERTQARRAIRLDAPTIVQRHVVDFSDFDDLPAKGCFRAKHPEIGDRPIVLFMSRLHPKKGLDLLVPAFARANLPEAVLVIAGPDEDGYAEEIKKLAIREGIADRVLFAGMLRGRERVEAMADASLFALPSYQENFGIVVIEALASGLPVVVSDQVNIHRVVTRRNFGAVVPVRVAPLSEAIRTWMSDDFARSRVSDEGPTFVRSHYSPERIGADWVRHYAGVTDR